MKRVVVLLFAASTACAGVIPTEFSPLGVGGKTWPTWSTTPYPLSKAFAAYRRTFAEPDAVITYSNGPAHGRGSGAFVGGVVTPDGRVVLVPYSSSFIGMLSAGASVPMDACLSPLFNKF